MVTKPKPEAAETLAAEIIRDFESLTANLGFEEARELQKLASGLFETRAAARRAELERMAAELGLVVTTPHETAVARPRSPAAGTGAPKARKRTSDLPVKFRNPAEPNNTWTGQGRKPKWLVEKLAAGQAMEAFAVQPPEQAELPVGDAA